MASIFIAADPQNYDFVAKLSQDLQAANLQVWYPAEPEAEIYSQLQQASHVVAVLTPAALQNENFLAALEYARQNDLPSLPLRLQAVETFPPQLQGSIPIDFSKPESYSEALETLLEDLNLNTKPVAALPIELIDRLHSENLEERQEAILKLRDFKEEGETLRNLARNELVALVFRERDPALKALLATALKLFDHVAEDPLPDLPSKEALVEQAEQAEMNVVIETRPLRRTSERKYLWQAPRWHLIVGGLGFLLAGGVFVFSREYAYVLPLLFISLLLPHLNILIRQDGKFNWKPSGAIVGNLLLGLLLGGIIAALFFFAEDLGSSYFLAVLGLCGGYALLVGGLSTARV